MDAGEAHLRFERLLADTLLSKDPAQLLERANAEPGLLEALGLEASAIDPDALRLGGLLVAKLRFERLLRGSSEMGERFEADPRGFTETFRRYHAEVPPTTAEPREEKRLFEAWEGKTSSRPSA
jgi:hypothetical protein